MRKKWWIALVAPPAIVLFVWVFGEIVMHLWNWLTPGLFGWHAITFWQALGLLVLCRILFGGWGNGGGQRGRRKGRRNADLWEAMTPEEREQFRQRIRARCSPFGSSGTQTASGSQPASGN
jgi:hypothetical protein